MGKHQQRKRGKEPRESGYVALHINMLESPAWKVLSPNARTIFPHILAQWKFETKYMRLTLPARHTEWMMRREQRAAADRELVEKGFLNLVVPAGRLTAAVYSRSERWKEVSKKILADPAQGAVIVLRVPTKGKEGISRWEPSRRPKNPTQRECGMKGKTPPDGRTLPGNRYKRPTQGGQAKGGRLPTQGGQARALLAHTGGTSLAHTVWAGKRKSWRGKGGVR